MQNNYFDQSNFYLRKELANQPNFYFSKQLFSSVHLPLRHKNLCHIQELLYRPTYWDSGIGYRYQPDQLMRMHSFQIV